MYRLLISTVVKPIKNISSPSWDLLSRVLDEFDEFCYGESCRFQNKQLGKDSLATTRKSQLRDSK
jgi:hypothetical protein